MILYHGTADYNLPAFASHEIRKYPRAYIKGFKSAFCTSLQFDEAKYFALRKTPMNDLSRTGVVLEFDGGNLIENKDFVFSVDSRAMRDEREASILNTKKLKLVACWKLNHKNQKWEREEVSPMKT
jgi:hypothetical protein